MFAKHQTWGEKDCYGQKISVLYKCRKNIKLSGPYVRPVPGDECCHSVIASDMVCVCKALDARDIFKISCVRLVDVMQDCGKSMPVGTICGSK